MADVHVFQWVVLFAAALYLTFRLFMQPPTQRWRHVLLSVVGVMIWIPTAYLANNVGVASSGVTMAFGSDALAVFGIFMVLANILGLVLGLLFWVEDEAMAAHESLPQRMQHRARRGD